MSASYSFSQQDTYDYVNQWVECTVTLQQWIEFRSVDIRAELTALGLTKQQYTSIYKHQVKLFNEQVNITFIRQYRDPFDRIQGSEEKQQIALRDLELIELITKETVTSFQRESLRNFLDVKFRKKTAMQIELIIRNKFQSSDNFSIHHPDNFLHAAVLLRYKEHLKKFLNMSEAMGKIGDMLSELNKHGGISSSLVDKMKNFFVEANPYNATFKYSYLDYIMLLDDIFENLSNELTLTYPRIPIADKQIFSRCLINRMHELIDAFVYKDTARAEQLLDASETDIFDLVDTLLLNKNINKTTFPGLLACTLDEISNNPECSDNEKETHKSFITFVSVHFIIQLSNHLRDAANPRKAKINDTMADYTENSIPKEPTIVSETGHSKNVAFTLVSGKNKAVRIKRLYKFLMDNKFIHEATSIEDFRAIFNNEIPAQPICWTGNISELSYFIKLIHSEKPVIKKIYPSIWQVVNEIFVDSNGKPFGWQRFRKQSLPATADLLETAVWNLA